MLVGSCGGEATSRAPGPQTSEPAPERTGAPGPLVVFLGDSLTAGFGVPAEAAFPARIADALAAEGRPIRFVNAGVSGDSTAGGVRRIDWVLRQKPDVVVVELGGNDGLRGLDPRQTEANLREILSLARSAGAATLLLGMKLPTSLGPEYAREFEAIFPRVASATGSELIPFFLDGIGGVERLNQPDGIHPTAEGHMRAARNVIPSLKQLLDARRSARSLTENPSR